MPDRWFKTHPWRVDVQRPFDTYLNDPYHPDSLAKIHQEAGTRMFHTKREALEFAASLADLGDDYCSDVYPAGARLND